MDERPDSSQQLMDILLVMDEKGTLQAVSGVKDGELQTKNPLEDNNDLPVSYTHLTLPTKLEV